MKLPIIKVGNSRGIRIPKIVIEECGFDKEVNLEIKSQSVVITPVQGPRSGWSEAFQKMAQSSDDELLDESLATEWEEKEWEWK